MSGTVVGKQCVRCSKVIGPYLKKYCSPRCRNAAKKLSQSTLEYRSRVKANKERHREEKLAVPVKCGYCGELYKRIYSRQKYCKWECMEARSKEQRREYRNREDVRVHTTAYNQKYYKEHVGLVDVNMTCRYCGGGFVRQSPAQKFCSVKCRTVNQKRWRSVNANL